MRVFKYETESEQRVTQYVWKSGFGELARHISHSPKLLDFLSLFDMTILVVNDRFGDFLGQF